MHNDIICNHYFDFSPKSNGGETLTLTTNFHDNGDGEIYLSQKLTLQSYGNAASFDLCGITLTPENLRKLANELEEKQHEILKNIKKNHE